MIYRLSTKLVG